MSIILFLQGYCCVSIITIVNIIFFRFSSLCACVWVVNWTYPVGVSIITERQKFPYKNNSLDTWRWPFRPKHVVNNLLNNCEWLSYWFARGTVSTDKNWVGDAQHDANIKYYQHNFKIHLNRAEGTQKILQSRLVCPNSIRTWTIPNTETYSGHAVATTR
jgi:hypothetical protein